MADSLSLKLIKLHLLTVKGTYVRAAKIPLPDGREQEVTVFTGNRCLFLGQCTPLRTIIIHEAVFGDERLFNYVLSHEVAHKRQWWSFLNLPLALLAILLSPRLLNDGLISLGRMIAGQDWGQLSVFANGLGLGLLLIALPFAFSWVLELDAEFKAIKAIGLDTFVDLRFRVYRPVKCNLLVSAINSLTHPPAGLVTGSWKWLHRNDNTAESNVPGPVSMPPVEKAAAYQTADARQAR